MNFKKILLLSYLFTSLNPYIACNEEPRAEWDESENSNDCKLHVRLLCAAKVKARCLDAARANIDDLSAQTICTESLKSKSICTENLGVNTQGCIQNLVSTSINTQNLCVGGAARFNEICQNYKAIVDFTADTSYTLGTLLSFTNIIEDPNNNITLSPTTYTVPKTGTYVMTLQVDQKDLVTNDVIIGTPVGILEIIRNGALVHTQYSPYLTFNNEQRAAFTLLIKLNAGDIIQNRYNVLYVNNTGPQNVTGSVTILSGQNNTLFSIHYLSSTCENVPCVQPCSPCDTSCVPNNCHASCAPCPK